MLMILTDSGKQRVLRHSRIPESKTCGFQDGTSNRGRESQFGKRDSAKEKAGTLIPAVSADKASHHRDSLAFLFPLRRFPGPLLGGFLFGFRFLGLLLRRGSFFRHFSSWLLGCGFWRGLWRRSFLFPLFTHDRQFLFLSLDDFLHFAAQLFFVFQP